MAFKISYLWINLTLMTPNVTIDEQLLCGLEHPDLVEVPQFGCHLHAVVLEPFLQLSDRAQDAGFSLRVASSYRSFERQLHIWNSKVCGLRPVLDNQGEPLDINCLTERELVFSILRWSALPGSSRHHWGTDMDVYDSSRIPAGYAVQLTLEETLGTGPFAPFHRWLTIALEQSQSVFFRPYAVDRGGVAPEPWHISYAPLAREFSLQFSEDILHRRIQDSDILLKPYILDHLSEIYQRFVRVAP